jgi:uncharacterized protein DUF6883
VFAAVGFDEDAPDAPDAFVAELSRIAVDGDVDEVEDTEFGRKYTVPGDLRGSMGTAEVITVWIQEAQDAPVRLVTVRPR